jgi:hypothetical protein
MKQAEKEILMTNEITMKTEMEMELGNYGESSTLSLNMQTLQSMLGIEKAAVETSLDDRARLFIC